MPKKKKTPGVPAIRQLPSGNWRAQAYDFTDQDGKRHYRSFTGPTQNDVALQVLQYKQDKHEQKMEAAGLRVTVGAAVDQYISAKSSILSPSSIREYRRIRQRSFQSLMPLYLEDLSPLVLQAAVNREAEGHSPKTVRDTYGLIRASVHTLRPDINMSVAFPQKIKTEIQIPSEGEVQQMIAGAKGKAIYLPVLLGACCGLRRSEIAALTWADIDFQASTLRICSALVYGEDGLTEKGTKTTSSTRTIRLIPSVLSALRQERDRRPEETEDSRITIDPNAISRAFVRLLHNIGCQHYRFHDLRHYTVSVMLSLNVPKSYIADYVGHETEHMIDQVYGHIMESKKTAVEDALQSYFSAAFPGDQ